MPQVVACQQCRQQFLAEDHLAGTVVPCPGCGMALAIGQPSARSASAMPAPLGSRPAASPAAAKGAWRGWLNDFVNLLPADPRGRDRTIGKAVIAVACAIWLISVLPSLPFLLTGFRAPYYYQIAGRLALFSAAFWAGILATCGGLFEWKFFMETRDMRVTRDWFGQSGARWFLICIGGFVAAVGLMLLIVPQLMGLIYSVRASVEGPIVPPARLGGEPAPPAVLGAGPVPELSSAAMAGRPGADLPGTWRLLIGGYAIKLPASMTIVQEEFERHDGQIDQAVVGRTKAGQDGIVMRVHVAQNPGREYPNIAQLVRDDAGARHLYRGEAVEINGLLVHRSDQVANATEQYGDERFVHRGVRHHLAGPGLGLWIDLRSRFPADHPDVQAFLPYVQTLQAVEIEPEEPHGLMSQGGWAGQWRTLPGRLCLFLPSSLEVARDKVLRSPEFQGHESFEFKGRAADGTEFEVRATFDPNLKHVNQAGRMKLRHRHGEVTPVRLHGLLLSRKSQVSEQATEVQYEFREGPCDVSIKVHCRAPQSDEALRGLLAYAETLQRGTSK